MPVAAVEVIWNLFYAQQVRLGTFDTELDRLVNFRGKLKFSILVGFWHLSRLRVVLLFDDGLQTLWQTLKQVPVAATDVVWNPFDGQNVRLVTFGTELDRLVNFHDEWKFSIFGRFWNLRVGIVLDGRHAA